MPRMKPNMYGQHSGLLARCQGVGYGLVTSKKQHDLLL